MEEIIKSPSPCACTVVKTKSGSQIICSQKTCVKQALGCHSHAVHALLSGSGVSNQIYKYLQMLAAYICILSSGLAGVKAVYFGD